MEKQTSRVAVVGASGYAGEELLAILARHAGVELVCLTSRQYAGRQLEEVYPRLRRMRRADPRPLPALVAPEAGTIIGSGAEYVFLSLPHGLAAEYAVPLLAAGLRVIDLSADFRLRDPAVYRDFYAHEHPAPALLGEAVYGMPELPGRRARVAAARLLAAPGCYPTSILLPLAPLLAAGLIDPARIFISSLSGVTGAGRKASVDLLFAEVNESAKAYGAPRHRHLSEIEQELSLAADGTPVIVNFTPHLIPISRGMLTTIYVEPVSSTHPTRVAELLASAYRDEPFIRLAATEAAGLPEIAHVARTNFIDIACRHDPRTGRWVLFSALDNLVKGAAGQAVQCFNLMSGWPETTAL